MDDLNAVTLELLRMFSGRAFHNSGPVFYVEKSKIFELYLCNVGNGCQDSVGSLKCLVE